MLEATQPEAAAVLQISTRTLSKRLKQFPQARLDRPQGRVNVDLEELAQQLAQCDLERWHGLDYAERLEQLRSETIPKGSEGGSETIPKGSEAVQKPSEADPQESNAFLVLRDVYQERGELVRRLDGEIREARQETKRRVRRWQIVAAMFLVTTGIVGTVAGWTYGQAVGGQAELAGVRVELLSVGEALEAERLRTIKVEVRANEAEYDRAELAGEVLELLRTKAKKQSATWSWK